MALGPSRAPFFLMTKEQEILSAAEEEFLKNGYDATSTAVIARKAGVTHAMVNYYYRTKEKLFMQILDNHVFDILKSLKPLMRADADVIEVSTDAALAIFDKLNESRRFPYLLSDIARMHPDFLLRYKDTFDTVCGDRLQQRIADGTVRECTMNDIYNSVVTLATMPFLSLPMLENVAGMTPERIDTFLLSRREEMVKILRARYSQE